MKTTTYLPSSGPTTARGSSPALTTTSQEFGACKGSYRVFSKHRIR
ncbi:MAG: hypothetical protein ACPF9Z_09085 [Paracoccaceae bacterium]